jgi:competence protein ComEC
VNRGLKFIAELPFSTISEIWINKWELLLLVGGITLLCYALIFYRKWMLYAALGLTLALVTSLTLQTANHHRQRKLIFFSLPKNHAVAFLQGDKAVIITDLQPSAPAYRVNIQPFLDQTQIKQVKIIQPHETYRTKKLMISGHQAHFYSQTILLADTCFNAKHLLQDQHFNTVLLSSNSRVNPGQLLLQTSPGHLVVDGSNNTFAAERYENAAKKFNVPVQNLKKIKAYLVNLK